jgi:multiple sugar transport system permease protein
MNAFLNLFGHTPLARRKALWGIAFILPNTLGLFIFYGIPVLIAFVLSLYRWNVFRPPQLIGLGNFQTLIGDPLFWKAAGVSVKLFFLVVPAEIVLSLCVAVLLNQPLRGRSIWRTAYFLPVVTSTAAASVVWVWIFQPRFGLLDNILTPFGLVELQWTTRPDLVLFPIAVVVIWQRLGFDMILFLAGLQAIPQTLYEAALIDGATKRQRFFRITVPLLSPTTFLVIILSIIQSFQIFDQIYVITARSKPGGVDNSATNLSYYMYRVGFVDSKFGYASTIALVLFVFILMVTVIQFRIQRRWVYYESSAE